MSAADAGRLPEELRGFFEARAWEEGDFADPTFGAFCQGMLGLNTCCKLGFPLNHQKLDQDTCFALLS